FLLATHSLLTFSFLSTDTPPTELYTLSLHDALPISNSAGATQSSPLCAKHSSDARPTASSDMPLRISAWLRENPARPFRYPPGRRRVSLGLLLPAPPPPANPLRQFLPRGRALRRAPRHSSIRAHCPANRISRWRPAPCGSGVGFAPPLRRAFGERSRPAGPCRPCARAREAARGLPR